MCKPPDAPYFELAPPLSKVKTSEAKTHTSFLLLKSHARNKIFEPSLEIRILRGPGHGAARFFIQRMIPIASLMQELPAYMSSDARRIPIDVHPTQLICNIVRHRKDLRCDPQPTDTTMNTGVRHTDISPEYAGRHYIPSWGELGPRRCSPAVIPGAYLRKVALYLPPEHFRSSGLGDECGPA